MACDFVLFRHLIFEARDLGPVFRAEIWRIFEEPTCTRCWCEQEQADEEDVMFHIKGGDEKQAGAHEENRPASGLMPVAAFIKELAA